MKQSKSAVKFSISFKTQNKTNNQVGIRLLFHYFQDRRLKKKLHNRVSVFFYFICLAILIIENISIYIQTINTLKTKSH